MWCLYCKVFTIFRLPYAEATLTEALRINPVAAISPLHRVMKDTKLNGYDIPKVN